MSQMEVFELLLNHNYFIDHKVEKGKFIINGEVHIPVEAVLTFSHNDIVPVNKQIIDLCQRRDYKLLMFYNEKLASLTPEEALSIKSDNDGKNEYYLKDALMDDFEVSEIFTQEKEYDFVQLHMHTEYSVLDGIIRPKDLVDFAIKHSIPAVCATDHGALGCHLPLFLEARRAGVKPIFGVEGYLVDHDASEHDKDESRYHITLIAKNETGYKNILALNRYATENFYYNPRMDVDSLLAHSEGVICMTACMGGYIPSIIRKNNYVISKEIKGRIDQFKKAFSKDFYFEVMPLDYEGVYDELNYALFSYAKKESIGVVATNDVHFLYKRQQQMHKDFIKISNINFEYNNDDIYYKNKHGMIIGFKKNCPQTYSRFRSEIREAIDNVDDVVSKCDYEMPLGDFKIPDYNIRKHYYFKHINWNTVRPSKMPPCASHNKKNQLFYLLLNDRLKELADKEKMLDKEYSKYVERLEYEFETIVQLDAIDYFLIVDDLFEFCYVNDILAHCRGSVGGSLVAYLLDFILFDPVKHKISFDRFISPARIESGENDIDIDIDVESDRRDEIFEYMSEKYGEERVCRVGAYQRLQIKQALKSLASVRYKMAELEDDKIEMNRFQFQLINKLTKDIFIQQSDFISNIFDLGLDDFGKNWLASNGYENYKWYLKYVKPVIGVVKSKSVHAAGLIITPEKYSDYLSVMKSKEGGIVTETENSHTGGEFLNACGIMTLDILGVKTMSIFKEAFDSIRERHDEDVNIGNIDVNDKRVIEQFGFGNTGGVFQFKGPNVTKFLKQLEPETFEQIIAVNALNRPGPLQSGAHKLFLARKKGEAKVEYLHPSVEAILKETFGVPIYSEHMMHLVTDFAGLPSVDADRLRKLQKGKKREEFMAFKDDFVKGAVAKWTDENKDTIRYIANEIWKLIAEHGRYNFPKAHATAYSLYAVVCMYLKVYYSLEFFTAWLNYTEKSKLHEVIREVSRFDVDLVYPSINASRDRFMLDGNRIVMPLNMIKGVGDSVYGNIMNMLPFDSFEYFVSVITENKKMANKTAATNMIIGGCFADITDLSIKEQLALYYNERRELLPEDLTASDEIDLVMRRSEVLGVDMINYTELFDGVYQNFVDKTHDFAKMDTVFIGNEYNLLGKVVGFKEHVSKKGRMAFITIRDKGADASVVAFNDFWKEIQKDKSKKPKKGDVILICAKGNMRNGTKSFILEPECKLNILHRG